MVAGIQNEWGKPDSFVALVTGSASLNTRSWPASSILRYQPATEVAVGNGGLALVMGKAGERKNLKKKKKKRLKS